MKYPEFLKPGGTIGFVAPSFGASIEPYRSAFLNALDKFRAAGYKTALGENCFALDGVGISNTPEKCGAELNEMYLRSEADAILSCGGGELMCEVVPYIDFAAVAAAKPKWYMGYSDNTNFTFLSATLADTAAIYGPCAPSFGMEPPHPSLNDALAVLRGEKTSVTGYDMWEIESKKGEGNPLEPYNLTENTRYCYFNAGARSAHMSGRLLGGCVDCLVNLLGTKFDRVREFNERYRADGVIWFLECCDLNPFGMRRAFWQMKNAGWFDTAKGFLVGRPLHFNDDFMGLDRLGALEPLQSLGLPIVADVDIGHLPPMLPIVTGAAAEVRAKGNRLEIKYSFA